MYLFCQIADRLTYAMHIQNKRTEKTAHHHHHHHFRLKSVFPRLRGSDCFSTMALLHTARSCAVSLFSPNLLISSSTHSFHFFLPLPRPLEPATSISLQDDTQFSASIRST